MNRLCVVFDLDDTLYKEIDFVESAYCAIGERLDISAAFEVLRDAYARGLNPFETLIDRYSLLVTKEELLDVYRYHKPALNLPDSSLEVLEYLKLHNVPMGIISDGRSVTQRNKIEALGLNSYICDKNIVISEEFGSEKPDLRNYRYCQNLYPEIETFVYIADNPRKDFVAPRALGWKTIGLLDDGRNIHSQSDVEDGCLPDYWIKDIIETIKIIQQYE